MYVDDGLPTHSNLHVDQVNHNCHNLYIDADDRVTIDTHMSLVVVGDTIVNQGLIYIAENRELFPYMTVLENLKLGAYAKNARPHEKRNLEWVFELFPRLVERRRQLAQTMSGGEARMLAVARGLMSNADFLCIDEPSLGLQPSLRNEIFSIIKQISKEGKTVFLVEQNIPQITELADRIYVMEEGQISFEGSKDEAVNNEHLREIFLGM